MPTAPPAIGAERRPRRDLARPRRRLRQQQAGDVGARDQQDEGDGGLQDDERPPRVAVVDDVQRVERDAPPGVGLRILFGERGGDDVHLRLRLFDRRAAPQTRHHVHHARRALPLHRVVGLRDPHVGVEQQAEPLRHHADDRHRHVVEHRRGVDDVGAAAEARLPELVADDDVRDHDRRLVLFRQEGPAQLRAHLQHLEHAGGEPLRVQLLGEAAFRRADRQHAAVHPADRLERLVPLPQRRVLGQREHRDAVALIGRRHADLDQPIHVTERRLVEGRLEQPEDGGVGADADADHEDHREGDAPPPADLREREPDVLDNGLHRVNSSG